MKNRSLNISFSIFSEKKAFYHYQEKFLRYYITIKTMLLTFCTGKIHRATITDANLNYEGSLTVDRDLLDASGMRPYQHVSVVNVNNGSRLETYIIEGMRGSGTICLNGAAARLGAVGDKVIILTYGMIEESQLPKDFHPKVVLVDDNNKIKSQVK